MKARNAPERAYQPCAKAAPAQLLRQPFKSVKERLRLARCVAFAADLTS